MSWQKYAQNAVGAPRRVVHRRKLQSSFWGSCRNWVFKGSIVDKWWPPRALTPLALRSRL